MTKSASSTTSPASGDVRRKRLVKELGGVNAVKRADARGAPGPAVAARRRWPEAVHDKIHGGRPAMSRRPRGPVGAARAVVAGRVHRRGRPRVRGADPAARRRSTSPGPRGCSTSGAARARSPGWPCAGGAQRRRSASTRRGRRSRSRRSGAAEPGLRPRRARRRCRSPTASFDAAVACLVFEHIRDVDDAIAEVARVLRAGRPVPVPPEPPAAADAEQRLDRRPGARPARAVLAHRPLPRRGRDDRGGGEGRVHPVHPPPAVPLPQRAGRRRASCCAAWRSRPRRPASSPGPPSTQAAATIPRLLFLRLEKT